MNSKENIFGERLRMLRTLDDSKSQKEFAIELGIPQPTLSSYESGKIKPTIDAVINIADKCGVSIDWLCGRDQETHINSLGDVLSLFLELYEIKEFDIKTIIHDRVDIEERDAVDDKDRNWVELKFYRHEVWHNPECVLNSDLVETILKAYKLNQELRRYERNTENYTQEKKQAIEYRSKMPVTKIDHSDITEEERREKMFAILKEEMENGSIKSS